MGDEAKTNETKTEDGNTGGDESKAGEGSGGGEPFATFRTREAFDERVERASRARMREQGFDPDAAKKVQEELSALKQKDEERRAAEMSEVEKAQAAAKKSAEALTVAEARAEAAVKEAEIAKLAAAHRVPDLDYLGFRLKTCPADADRGEWLSKLLEDAGERARFGIDEPSTGGAEGAEKKAATTTTTTRAGGNEPAPPKTGGAPDDGAKSAMTMTPAEFADYKRQKYGAGGRGTRRGYKPPPR